MDIEALKKELLGKGELYLRVSVRPNAPETKALKSLEDGTIKLDLRAKPERGKANEELAVFLAKSFKIPKENVRILSGFTDRIKLVKITLE